MKKVFGFILVIGIFVAFLRVVNAAEFSNAYLRLDRTKANTATGGTVCAQTSTTATENSVEIVFPDDFGVNSTESNWTVNTSSLPNGASPWPGIGTSIDVDQDGVTFPSGNLITNTLYCFNFSGVNTLTTGPIGEKTGEIVTFTSGSGQIDSTIFGLSVKSNDQITVTAEVAANSTDFDADLEVATTGDTFPQETTLTYNLEYGSNLSYPTTITVEAEWSMGETNGAPTAEILDYVVGSATDGYSSSPPIVDSVNRTISWEIPVFPGNTNDTVSFQLRTNSNYVSASTLTFDVTGRVVGSGTQTPDSTITRNYQYSFPPTPTATPTSQPQTESSSSSSPPSFTPTPAPEPLAINSIEIRTIGTTSSSIAVSASQNSNITINYGLLPGSLTSSFTIESASSAVFELSNLTPNTMYYFQIFVKSGGIVKTSDIFTFTTSLSDTLVRVIPKSFIVLADDNVIFQQRLADENKIDNTVVLPTNKDFIFNISIDNHEQIRSIQAFMRHKFVLQANSELAESNINVTLVETSPGEFAARLNTGVVPGHYELFLRISDNSGNIFEHKTADIKITTPFKIIDEDSKSPVEGARVKLHIYNHQTRLYEDTPSLSSNVLVSDTSGIVDLTLPQGQYKAEISSIFHEKKTIEFVLGANKNEDYPTVELKRSILNPVALFNYGATTISDFSRLSNELIQELSSSNRIFNISAFLILSLLTILSFLSLLLRTHHSPKSFVHYVFYALTHRKINTQLPQKGQIFGENGKAIGRAIVSFLKRDEVIYQTQSNSNGIFFVNGKNLDYIQISKIGYEEMSFPFNHQLDSSVPRFHLKKRDGIATEAFSKTLNTVYTLFGVLFEFIVVLLIVLELLFIPNFGIIKVAPFLTIAILMVLVFFHHKLDN